MSPVSSSIRARMEQSSWIRRMFEEGAKLRAERGAENVVDLSLGNPEVEPPVALERALRAAVEDSPPGAHGYMTNAGFVSVRERVASWLRGSSDVEYGPEHVVMTAGAASALNALLRAILEPGDEVVVLAPYFPEYRFYIENHGGNMIVAETDESFRLDVGAVEAVLTDRTRAVLVNAPNNPSGAIYTEASLAALGGALARRCPDAIVISDEPYKALTFDDRRSPEIARVIERTVIATSWSKALAIAGERIGFIAVSPRIPGATELAQACTFALRTLGFVNASALWQRVVGEVCGLTIDIAPYQAKRDVLCDGLEEAGYELVRPSGAFYVFPKTPLADDVAFVHLLRDEGILAVPGVAFGRAGHMRLSLTVPLERVERSLAGFAAARKRARAT